MAVYIGSSFGHFTLDSWRLAKLIQLAVMDFCRDFLNHHNDPCGRQFDQTTQAARAVPANIAEGSARHSTSVETEMRLLDVARASLSEVLDDFIFFLLDSNNEAWTPDNPNASALRQFRLEPCNSTVLSEVCENIRHQAARLSPWLKAKELHIRANAIIVLCMRLIKLLRTQIENRLQEFSEKGGFTENLTQTRIEAKQREAADSNAPACPKCGKPMVKRIVKKGGRQGQMFWGCSVYPQCNGIRDIE